MKNPFQMENKLDEMQTQKLLTINSRGFWGAWAALLVAILVQSALDTPPAQYMAEWIIFMLMCVYGAFEYLRNGIWTSFDVKPNAKTNANCKDEYYPYKPFEELDLATSPNRTILELEPLYLYR